MGRSHEVAEVRQHDSMWDRIKSQLKRTENIWNTEDKEDKEIRGKRNKIKKNIGGITKRTDGLRNKEQSKCRTIGRAVSM